MTPTLLTWHYEREDTDDVYLRSTLANIIGLVWLYQGNAVRLFVHANTDPGRLAWVTATLYRAGATYVDLVMDGER